MINYYAKADDDIQSYKSKLELHLTKCSDKFFKKYENYKKPFWKKWKFWGILISTIISLWAFLKEAGI